MLDRKLAVWEWAAATVVEFVAAWLHMHRTATQDRAEPVTVPYSCCCASGEMALLSAEARVPIHLDAPRSLSHRRPHQRSRTGWIARRPTPATRALSAHSCASCKPGPIQRDQRVATPRYLKAAHNTRK
jgi:hypothetical protein